MTFDLFTPFAHTLAHARTSFLRKVEATEDPSEETPGKRL